MKEYSNLSGSSSEFFGPYFKKAFIVSGVFHASLFTLACVLPFIPFFQGKKVMYYSHAIRVDLVGLPEKIRHKEDTDIISTQEKIKEVIRKKEEQIKEEPNTLRFKSKKEKENFRKKQLSALKRLEALKALERKQIKTKKEALRKGNIMTSGVDSPSDINGEVLSEYEMSLKEKIKLRWALPSYLLKQKQLMGNLIIYLDRDGSIIRKQIVSSGNREFDLFMNQALEEALPFPTVPNEIYKDLRYDGISITFSAGELK